MKQPAVAMYAAILGALSAPAFANPPAEWKATHEKCSNVLVVENFKEAEPLCAKALQLAEASGDRTATVLSLRKLRELYVESKQAAKAEATLKKELAYHEKAFGPGHGSTAQVLMHMGNFYQKAQNKPAARAAYQRALDINAKVHGPTHPETNSARNRLEDLGA